MAGFPNLNLTGGTSTATAGAQGSEINAPFSMNASAPTLMQYVMIGAVVVALIMFMRR
jgi:hypothetical protein